MKRKFLTLEEIEREFEKIEKLGYRVGASEDSCQIWDGTKLLIDADFQDTYQANAIDAINSFWDEE